MGILDNKFQLALVAIVGAAIIGMVVAVPGLAANAQISETPTPSPALPGETPEEPAPGEESLLDEEPLPAPEEGGAMAEVEPAGPEAEGEGKFSSSVTVSPAPDAEAIVSIEGAGMTVEDMNVDQSTTGGTSTIIVEGAFAIGSSGASEPAPEEEEPALGEEPGGLTPEEPAPIPSTPEEEGPEALPPLEEAPAPGEEAAPGEEPLAPIPGEETGGLTPEEPTAPGAPEETESEITPTQFPAPAPPTEEEPAPGEESLPGEEPLPAPGEEAPAPGEESTAPEEEPLPAPAPAPTEEPSLTPEEGAMTEEEPSDEDEMKPERTLEDGFFNAVTFSPAEGSWVSVAIEGTGMTVQGMSVNQMMEGEDTFRVTVEVTLAHEGVTTPAPGPITPTPTAPGTVAPTQETTPEGAAPTSNAAVSLFPASAVAGSQVTVSGTGFASMQTVTLQFDGASVTTDPITTDPIGSFAAPLTIPPEAAAGDHQVTASDASGNSVVTNITVEGTAVAPEAPAPTTPEAITPTPPELTTPETSPTEEVPPTPEELTSPEAEPAPGGAEATLPSPEEAPAPAPGEETTTPETTPTIP